MCARACEHACVFLSVRDACVRPCACMCAHACMCACARRACACVLPCDPSCTRLPLTEGVRLHTYAYVFLCVHLCHGTPYTRAHQPSACVCPHAATSAPMITRMHVTMRHGCMHAPPAIVFVTYRGRVDLPIWPRHDPRHDPIFGRQPRQDPITEACQARTKTCSPKLPWEALQVILKTASAVRRIAADMRDERDAARRRTCAEEPADPHARLQQRRLVIGGTTRASGESCVLHLACCMLHVSARRKIVARHDAQSARMATTAHTLELCA